MESWTVTGSKMRSYDLLRRIVDFLERESIAYCVVGSMASIVYGEPRFTNDIDILVDLPLAKVDALCREFPDDDYYISPEAARTAIARRHQFDILHFPSGLKIDLFLVQDTDFSRADLSQGRRLKSEGFFDARFASPENVILKKLEYYREGGSEKHLRDIAGILTVQGDSIDRTWIEAWAVRLGVEAEWAIVRDRRHERPV